MASDRTINILLPTGRCEAVRLASSAVTGEILLHLQAEGATSHAFQLTRNGLNLDPAASLESLGLADGDTVSCVETAIDAEVMLEIVLPSGRSAKVKGKQEMSIKDVRCAAQKVLCEGFLKLAIGEDLLDPKLPLNTIGVKDQATVSAIVQPAKLAASTSCSTFALWFPGGQVVTWGRDDVGGDISSIHNELSSVQHVEANRRAFAALRSDGTVCTWGSAGHGGDSRQVQERLKDVVQICPVDDGAFVARRSDGSIVTWGQPSFGGDSRSVQEQLTDVQKVCATSQACAAIRADGSLVTWGHLDAGADSRSVQSMLVEVKKVCGSQRAFAAIVKDGGVVSWGRQDTDFGADSGSVQHELRGVQQLCSSTRAFAAIKGPDGSVVTWGDPGYGGDSSEVSERLTDVQSITASHRAFAAKRTDGSVVTWGDPGFGGDSSQVSERLREVQQLHATARAFAALLADGSVVSWGDVAFGGKIPENLETELRTYGAKELKASFDSFAAVLASGEVISWGKQDATVAIDIPWRAGMSWDHWRWRMQLLTSVTSSVHQSDCFAICTLSPG